MRIRRAEKQAKKSAVMILLFHEDEKLKVVFIRRGMYVGIHAGQIAFPGGRFEDSDVTVENTAFREIEEEIGVTLTESMAMWPASSVSGYYFGNPESKYFGLGKIKEDQVIDYAKRRSISKDMAMKWLNPNIAD